MDLKALPAIRGFVRRSCMTTLFRRVLTPRPRDFFEQVLFELEQAKGCDGGTHTRAHGSAAVDDDLFHG